MAAALLPVFETQPECFDAIDLCDDDFSHGTLSEYLANWQSRVPEQFRPIVRRIAREFGLEISGDR